MQGAGADLAVRQRDADQRAGHALADGAQVMLGLAREDDATQLVAPGVVVAREILLIDEASVALDEHGVDVPVRVAAERLRHGLYRTRIHADRFQRCGLPAVVDRRRYVVEVALFGAWISRRRSLR